LLLYGEYNSTDVSRTTKKQLKEIWQSVNLTRRLRLLIYRTL